MNTITHYTHFTQGELIKTLSSVKSQEVDDDEDECCRAHQDDGQPVGERVVEDGYQQRKQMDQLTVEFST